MCIKTCDDIKFGDNSDGGHEGEKNNVILSKSNSGYEHFRLQLQLQAKLNKQKHKGRKLPNFKILMCCCYFIIIVLMI
ncbi:uncharacterized protein [Drosophila takahashii]|uniref:uncharacterized protein n=1 Tax=Drosophila takahashii TaxID=29030 RepID=UPI001CF87A18|nr:uncharacterized protein LOC108058208 [Drosophila takahashii]